MNSMPTGSACWKIGTTKGERGPDRWPDMRDGGYVAIGWPALGDLRAYGKDDSSRIMIRQKIQEIDRVDARAAGRAAGEILRFLQIAPRDSVLAVIGNTVLGVGVVEEGYDYVPSSDFRHHYAVTWHDVERWRLPANEGPRLAVYRLKDPQNISEVRRRLR